MTNSEITQIRNWIRKGAKIMVGTDYTGRKRIKVKHGPFGIFVSRFTCEPENYENLVAELYNRKAAVVQPSFQYST
jgi:hypothetical protein